MSVVTKAGQFAAISKAAYAAGDVDEVKRVLGDAGISDSMYTVMKETGNDALVLRLADGDDIPYNNPIVVSVRGTDISNATGNRVRDIAGEWGPITVGSTYLSSRTREIRDLVKHLRQMHPFSRIVLTGHSLGGWVATNIAMETGYAAVVFNPGMGADYLTGMTGLDNVIVYRTTYDPVSATGSKSNNVIDVPSTQGITGSHSIDNFTGIDTDLAGWIAKTASGEGDQRRKRKRPTDQAVDDALRNKLSGVNKDLTDMANEYFRPRGVANPYENVVEDPFFDRFNLADMDSDELNFFRDKQRQYYRKQHQNSIIEYKQENPNASFKQWMEANNSKNISPEPTSLNTLKVRNWDGSYAGEDVVDDYSYLDFRTRAFQEDWQTYNSDSPFHDIPDQFKYRHKDYLNFLEAAEEFHKNFVAEESSNHDSDEDAWPDSDEEPEEDAWLTPDEEEEDAWLTPDEEPEDANNDDLVFPSIEEEKKHDFDDEYDLATFDREDRVVDSGREVNVDIYGALPETVGEDYYSAIHDFENALRGMNNQPLLAPPISRDDYVDGKPNHAKYLERVLRDPSYGRAQRDAALRFTMDEDGPFDVQHSEFIDRSSNPSFIDRVLLRNREYGLRFPEPSGSVWADAQASGGSVAEFIRLRLVNGRSHLGRAFMDEARETLGNSVFNSLRERVRSGLRGGLGDEHAEMVERIAFSDLTAGEKVSAVGEFAGKAGAGVGAGMIGELLASKINFEDDTGGIIAHGLASSTFATAVYALGSGFAKGAAGAAATSALRSAFGSALEFGPAALASYFATLGAQEGLEHLIPNKHKNAIAREEGIGFLSTLAGGVAAGAAGGPMGMLVGAGISSVLYSFGAISRAVQRGRAKKIYAQTVEYAKGHLGYDNYEGGIYDPNDPTLQAKKDQLAALKRVLDERYGLGAKGSVGDGTHNALPDVARAYLKNLSAQLDSVSRNPGETLIIFDERDIPSPDELNLLIDNISRYAEFMGSDRRGSQTAEQKAADEKMMADLFSQSSGYYGFDVLYKANQDNMRILDDMGLTEQYSLGMTNDKDYAQFKKTLEDASAKYGVERSAGESLADYIGKLHEAELRFNVESVQKTSGIKKNTGETDEDYMKRVVSMQVADVSKQLGIKPAPGETDSAFLERAEGVRAEHVRAARAIEDLQRGRRHAYAREKGLTKADGETDEEFHDRIQRVQVYEANYNLDIMQRTKYDQQALDDYRQEEIEEIFGPIPGAVM